VVPNGLEDREDSSDERKEDDGGYDEEAEEVCNPGTEGEECNGEDRPVIPERDGVPRGVGKRGDVGEAEECRKECLGDVVVDVTEDRSRKKDAETIVMNPAAISPVLLPARAFPVR